VGSTPLARLVEQASHRYRDPQLVTDGLRDLPGTTLADGAAGVAYFLLRHASLGGGEALLAAAQSWAARVEHAGTADPPSTVVDHSLHYGQPGVWWVRALIAAARRTTPTSSDAVRKSAANDLRAYSLFHGDLGVALLAAELQDPFRAAMPVYQSFCSA